MNETAAADDAHVLIIGGGAMGVSLLYHLAERGISDVVLVEKSELTHGSTWHAAGLCTHFAHNPTVQALRARSIELYRDVLPGLGLDCGFHACGALRVTANPDRMDEFRHVRSLGRFTGHRFDILSPQELGEIYPLATTDGILGAIHEPFDGHVDPTSATNAMAAVARDRGAVVRRHTRVEAIERSGARWLVHTDKGSIRATHLVNAAGTWGWEIGQMLGVDLPVVPMLHQYIVTDPIPSLVERNAAGLPELPIIRDPEESWYLRQENDTYILGPYEKHATTWAVDGVPRSFGADLLPPDLDAVMHIVEMAMARVPALQSAGVKTVVNGPITFTPDANPLIGPVFGIDNAWLLTGSSMGVMEGGGAGRFLADWMVDGRPSLDAWPIDSRRFGDYADRQYRIDTAVECFGLQFGVHYPHEERPAGRPQRVTPLVDAQRADGATFGFVYGWERPNHFGPDGPDSFHRPAWHGAVETEVRRTNESVGVCDYSALSCFTVDGPDAFVFLDSVGANTAPAPGRARLMHVLHDDGGVAAEFVVVNRRDGRFSLTSAAFAQRHDHDLLRARATGFDVRVEDVTTRRGALGVMGPAAHDVLAELTDADLALPYLSAQETTVAGVDVVLVRISYVGEAGWEIHADLADLAELHAAVRREGAPHGMGPFGAYAIDSMRIEQGYLAMGAELTSERTPLEAGADLFVRTEGRSFVGRDRMLERERGCDRWSIVQVELADVGLDPFFGHALVQSDHPVGVVTSGGFGHRIGAPVALAYVRPGFDAGAGDIAVDLLGRLVPAAVRTPPGR